MKPNLKSGRAVIHRRRILSWVWLIPQLSFLRFYVLRQIMFVSMMHSFRSILIIDLMTLLNFSCHYDHIYFFQWVADLFIHLSKWVPKNILYIYTEIYFLVSYPPFFTNRKSTHVKLIWIKNWKYQFNRLPIGYHVLEREVIPHTSYKCTKK